MIKKLVTYGAAVALAVGAANVVFPGDAGNDQASQLAAHKQVEVDSLKVQFVPSANVDEMDAKTKPLERLLSAELGVPVKVSMSTDYNTVVEAMGAGNVDMGFLPPDPYVHSHAKYGTHVILQSVRYAIDHAKQDGSATDELRDTYGAMVLVGKDSGINSAADLKGKTIAVQNPTSTAGYIFPAVDLYKDGLNIMKDAKLVTVKGHDQGALAVLNGDTDAAFMYDDARSLVQRDNPDVFKQTKVLKYTEQIPSDTITVRKGISKHDREAIQKAMLKIANESKEGKQVMADVYRWSGVAKSDDSHFDKIREYQKAIKNIK